MTNVEQLLQQVRTELGAFFVSSDVVGLDGISIAGGSVDPNFDSAAASARLAMVMKLASQVCGKLALGAVEDDLVTTDKTFILSRFLGDGSYLWDVAVSREATLGTVRMMMNEYAPQLWDAIPR